MNAWEQQPTETTQQYRAFLCYVHAPKRSIDAAFREYSKTDKRQKATKSDKKKRPSASFRNWSDVFQWEQRAKAWDADMQRRQTQITSEHHEQFTHSLYGAANEALAAAKERLSTASLKELTAFLQFATLLDGTQAHNEIQGLQMLKTAMLDDDNHGADTRRATIFPVL